MIAGALIFLAFCIVSASFILVSVRIFQVRPDFVKTTASIDWENKW